MEEVGRLRYGRAGHALECYTPVGSLRPPQDAAPCGPSAYHGSVPRFALPRLRRADYAFLGVAVAIVVGDLLTKWAIRSWLDRGDAWPDPDWNVRIVHFTNTGAAFGILEGAGPLLVVTSIVGVALILVYLFNPGMASPLVRAGLALMLGGAIGNLIDRVGDGEVVDFIKFPEWPAFNVADSAITIGVIILVWALVTQTQTGLEDGDSSS